MAYCFTNDKIKGKGEDASFAGTVNIRELLTYLHCEESSLPGYITQWAGVCDGLGGKGGNQFLCKDGTQQSEAKIGSHFYADYIQRRISAYSGRFASCTDGLEVKAKVLRLKDDLHKRMMQELEKEYKAGTFGRSMSLNTIRRFPSTLAFMFNVITENGTNYLASIWSGDSRCYSLDRFGLHQISTDTSEDQDDALTDLRSSCSSPMKERLGLDMPEVELHCNVQEITTPTLGLCMSDGVYNLTIFTSPMKLEQLLLYSLEQSSSMETFMENLQGITAKYACDDSSISLIQSMGNDDIHFWKKEMEPRLQELEDLMKDDPGYKEKSPEYLQLQKNLKDADHRRSTIQEEFVNAPEFEEECKEWLNALMDGSEKLPYPNKEFTSLLYAAKADCRLAQDRFQQKRDELCRQMEEIYAFQYLPYAVAEMHGRLKNKSALLEVGIETPDRSSIWERYQDTYNEQDTEVRSQNRKEDNQFVATTLDQIVEEIVKTRDHIRKEQERIHVSYEDAKFHISLPPMAPEDYKLEELNVLKKEIRKAEEDCRPGNVILEKYPTQCRYAVKQFLLMRKIPFGEERWNQLLHEAEEGVRIAANELENWEKNYDAQISMIWEKYRKTYEYCLKGD